MWEQIDPGILKEQGAYIRIVSSLFIIVVYKFNTSPGGHGDNVAMASKVGWSNKTVVGNSFENKIVTLLASSEIAREFNPLAINGTFEEIAVPKVVNKKSLVNMRALLSIRYYL